MPPRLPPAIQRTIGSELTFQTGRGLRDDDRQHQNMIGDQTYRPSRGSEGGESAYLDEEEVSGCSEELIRDVDDLSTECYA